MSKLYPNCIPIIGHTSVAIYDLEKQCTKTYPKENFFKKGAEISDHSLVVDQLTPEARKCLWDDQFIMPDKEIPVLNRLKPGSYYKWKSPAIITNTIIEPSIRNGLLQSCNFKKLLGFLQQLLCKYIFIRIKETISLNELKIIVESLTDTVIQAVQLQIMYQHDFYTDEFAELLLSQSRIRYVIIQASPFEKNIENKIFFSKRILFPFKAKKRNWFVTNIHLFSESQLHHTYFNRKLYIGPKGEIKNAPECADHVGFIQQVETLAELLQLITSPAFKKYWYVSKDKCEICRVCEFKHMCVDNRIPHQRENGYWFHFEKCNYDPYTGKWEEA